MEQDEQDWFFPEAPVKIDDVKEYVEYIYKIYYQSDHRLFTNENKAWLSQRQEHYVRSFELCVIPLHTIRNEFDGFDDDTIIIRHFKILHDPLLRRAYNMGVEEKDGSITWVEEQVGPDTKVTVEMKRINQNQWTEQAFSIEFRKALNKIYAELVVSLVKSHLYTRRYIVKQKFFRDLNHPVRLKVGKSIVYAKRNVTFVKNDPNTWNSKRGFGRRWTDYYNGHIGSLLGYKGMMVVAVITVGDLPDYVKGNGSLPRKKDEDTQNDIDISSRETLASTIEDALGRPRDTEGNLREDGTLMLCPLDNDPKSDHPGPQAKGGDASVVYVVFRPDLEGINDNLEEEKEVLTDKVDELEDRVDELVEEMQWLQLKVDEMI